MRRAIGYVRASTAGNAERGISVAAQRDRITEYAKIKGWQLLGIVAEAKSGACQARDELSREHRPMLHKLIERARAGEHDVLLVARLDRLSRDHASLVILARRVQKAGVEIVSAAEETGDSALAECIRAQLALVARLERVMIRDRLSTGKETKKALGRHVHGRVPYGYRSQAGILSPIPELVPTIRRIFRDIADGRTPGRIARELTSEGITSPQGGAEWSANTVRLIATNPAYTGERYEVKRAHEAIVSRRAFNAAAKKLVERSRRSAAT